MSAGTVEEPRTGQRYWFYGGVFYAEMSRSGGVATFGEWKMSSLADALPEGAVGVWFGGPASDGGPSDVAGMSWHEAAVKARLEGAHARTERENARREVTRLERNAAGLRSSVQEEQSLRNRAVLNLEQVVRRLELAYGGDGSRTERAVWQDAGSDPSEWPREYWTTWPTDDALDNLVLLIGDLADADHPSVLYPTPGKRVRADAGRALREAIGAGGSLEDAAGVVLERAAMRARSEATSPATATTDRQE